MKEGDEVVVADLRVGKTYHGVVERIDDDTGKVIVQYDSGVRVSVGQSFVKLATEKR